MLSRPAAAIDQLDRAVVELCADLVDTMRAAGHSVGVAAPQIGVGRRAVVVDVTGHPKASSCHGLIVLVNPKVISNGGSEVGREGCMSVPELTGDVRRHTQITVAGLTPGAKERVVEADAFEARALQHELDHLDGLVFLDRVVSPARVFARRVYR